jgi:hypothetical protein
VECISEHSGCTAQEESIAEIVHMFRIHL